MSAKSARFSPAVTIVEVMITIPILVVVVLGTLSYQYHAARQERIGRGQITGIRTAQLLLEDWKSSGGTTEYRPSSLGLGFSEKTKAPSYWSKGVGQGLGNPLHNAVYSITVDGFSMLIALGCEDIDYDSTAQITLRQLSVVVRFAEGESGVSWEAVQSIIPPIILTSYVRVDAASG